MQRAVYKNYLLILLMAILASNLLDRLALGLVLQEIKTELNLSDTQLGFLTGVAFSLFYAVMGIPIARWADRGNRKLIISLTTALWSVAVALCGTATSFIHLLLIRIGVAVGESGCIPPAHSLIADYFDRNERPRAVARYLLGGPLALTVGYFATGWLNELYGWRTTFVIISLPGLVLAMLAWLTLQEPRRTEVGLVVGSVLPPSKAGSEAPSLREVFATLWSSAAFRHLLICFSVWNFFGYGLQQWQPAFFIRSHHLETGELGTWLAAIFGIGGGVGIYLGGELATRWAAGNERRQLYACGVAFAFFAVLKSCVYLAADVTLAFVLLAFATVGGNMAQGPIFASIQTLVQPHMRATSVALLYLFANLIGMGFGPLAVGTLSDAFRPWLGEESLRYALVALSPGYLWAAWHLWRAGKLIGRNLEAEKERVPLPTTLICNSRGSRVMVLTKAENDESV